MTIQGLVSLVRERLAEATHLQCADPFLHAKQIVQSALGMDATRLYLRWDSVLSPEEKEKCARVLERRLSGEPFQYITGKEGFWDAQYKVGPGVLIPRRETELLVELAIKELGENARVAELGAGSGNIGISVLRSRPDVQWHAFEKNEKSIPYLEQNRTLLLENPGHYQFHFGDFFEKAAGLAPFDAVISNPPYVSSDQMKTLPVEVTHEPVMALSGGEKGLDTIEPLVEFSARHLKPAGLLAFEIGSGQGKRVADLLSRFTFDSVLVLKDYGGLDRVAKGRWRWTP